MSRALLTLRSKHDRDKAIGWIARAPSGTRVEFRASKRTIPQNDKMWAILTEVAQQKEHGGRKYTPEQWKSIFMQAWGKEMDFVPTLDGNSFFPLGYQSSKLDKLEMATLIEFIIAWGVENGVEFRDM